jgi:hypothetical protein
VSRTATLLQLRTWARQLSDTEGDVNITDAELTALANRHLCEVWDRLVDAAPPDFYAATTAPFTTSAGVINYGLPVGFRNLLEVNVHESTDERRPLYPMPEGARGRFKAPSGEWTVSFDYVPAPLTLEDDGDTFDGISGFEEIIANLIARDVMAKRESDPSVVMANIARLEQRINSRSKGRDRGKPRRIVDLDDAQHDPYPWTRTSGSRLSCYRLRGDNLELYESLWELP